MNGMKKVAQHIKDYFPQNYWVDMISIILIPDEVFLVITVDVLKFI